MQEREPDQSEPSDSPPVLKYENGPFFEFLVKILGVDM
jgi:hypothetical protein